MLQYTLVIRKNEEHWYSYVCITIIYGGSPLATLHDIANEIETESINIF